VPKLFFLLSGEHKTLPFAETKAILKAEGVAYKGSQLLPQVLRLDSSVDAVAAIAARAALTRTCCQELFCCNASLGEIVKATQAAPLDTFLKPNESFAVRVRRVGEAGRDLPSMSLEKKLGEIVLNKIKKSKVNLEHPRKTFFGTITDGCFVFGLIIREVSPTPFVQRRPRKRPFFHPSAMPAKLARCMVNLARAKKGDFVLDPFCGTGSFLIEAGLLGCRVFGVDAKKRMIRGSIRNLKFFNIEFEGLAVAEARHLPLAKVDCIVTDPPYGRSASTMGQTTKQIVQEFLKMSADRMAKGQRMCIASPRTVRLCERAKELGFRRIQSHFVYVHRSLTREIAVLEQS